VLGLSGGAAGQPAPDSLGPLREESWLIEPIEAQLSLRVPVFVRGQLRDHPGGYYWIGNAFRFNLSLLSAAPECGGGTRHAQVADCFQARLRELPGLQPDSMRRQDLPGYSQLRYVQQVPRNEQKIRIDHVHLYLALRGHWVDVHASVILASPEEQRWLEALGESLRVDE